MRSYETSPELPCWSGITSPVICLERISKATSAASKYINFYYIRSTLICIYTLFHITFCISPKHQYQPDGVDIYYPLYHRESRSFVVQVWETLNERMKERETTIIKSFVCYPGLQSWPLRVRSHNKDHRNQPAEGPHYVVPSPLFTYTAILSRCLFITRCSHLWPFKSSRKVK